MMNIGDKAPEILGKDEQGREIRLSDYKGRKLVLYFYPKDNTSGCTAEACSLRDHYGELQGKGYEVVGVSKDSAASHVKFKEKYELPFPLIAGCMAKRPWAPSAPPLLSMKKASSSRSSQANK